MSGEVVFKALLLLLILFLEANDNGNTDEGFKCNCVAKWNSSLDKGRNSFIYSRRLTARSINVTEI